MHAQLARLKAAHTFAAPASTLLLLSVVATLFCALLRL